MSLTLDCERCPYCGADLVGDTIPMRDREFFGGATYFRRQIGIELDEDRIEFVQCPDCGARDRV